MRVSNFDLKKKLVKYYIYIYIYLSIIIYIVQYSILYYSIFFYTISPRKGSPFSVASLWKGITFFLNTAPLSPLLNLKFGFLYRFTIKSSCLYRNYWIPDNLLVVLVYL